MKQQRKRKSALAVGTVLLTTMLTAAGTPASDVGLTVRAADYDYAAALTLSLYLYDANKCGCGVTDGALTWRHDCHTYDAHVALSNSNLPSSIISSYGSILDPEGDGMDLSGGYHDAGDFVKFNLPAAYSCSTLAWGAYEFGEAFEQTGNKDHMMEILQWFCDYFIRCTFRDENGKVFAYCYQVGDGGADHSVWRGPEEDTESSMPRKAWFVTSENKSSDQCYEAAAALASCAVVWEQWNGDAAYAETLIDYAKALYAFGDECGGSITGEGCSSFYSSTSWQDDKAWASCWMYLATDEATYLNNAKSCSEYPGWFHSWDKVMDGYFCMANKLGFTPSTGTALGELNQLKNQYIKSSGYICGSDWGSCRYNAAWQLCALAYMKDSGSTEFASTVQTQMEYVLGNNNNNTSYLIGYGDTYPKHPHHRGSAQNLNTSTESGDHQYTLWGALVGGPDGNGGYQDITDSYQYSEVAIDYNAAMVGALAGMYLQYGGTETDIMTITNNASEINAAYVFGGDSGEIIETTTTETTTTTTTTPTTTETPVVGATLLGDADCNGVVMVADAVLISRYISEDATVTLTEQGKQNADMDGDSRIQVNDTNLLLQLLAQ